VQLATPGLLLFHSSPMGEESPPSVAARRSLRAPVSALFFILGRTRPVRDSPFLPQLLLLSPAEKVLNLSDRRPSYSRPTFVAAYFNSFAPSRPPPYSLHGRRDIFSDPRTCSQFSRPTERGGPPS